MYMCFRLLGPTGPYEVRLLMCWRSRGFQHVCDIDGRFALTARVFADYLFSLFIVVNKV